MTDKPLTADLAVQRIQQVADPAVARGMARFFKTGPGQYGEGDTFAGLNAAQVRTVAKEYRVLDLNEAVRLLQHPVHEARSVALLILGEKMSKGDAAARKQVFDAYLANTRCVNNWDLVDVSAAPIVGAYLADRSRSVLDRLAKSESLWERRISIVATLHFIRRGELHDTLRIAEHLFSDREDLIHKATGWMLREVGKKDAGVLETFLAEHHARMPRTTLRYAIERFPPERRKAYLRGEIR